MTTNTPATTTVALNITAEQLRCLVAELTERYPAAGARVEHAAQIALFRPMERSASGAWYVSSETQDGKEYIVAGADCTCEDQKRHGHLSPCKHRLATMIALAAERIDAATAPTLVAVDIAGEPVGFELTPAAVALLDERRQRNAARCPTCSDYKQHGDLFCAGNHCTGTPSPSSQPSCRLVAVV